MVCVYMAFEDDEDPGPESSIVLNQIETLDAIAAEVGVHSLSHFYDELGMQAEVDDLCDEGDDETDDETDEEEFPASWWPVADGIRTLAALEKSISTKPARVDNPEEMLASLREFRAALEQRGDSPGGWHLAIDY